jgi:hypothetical protein
MNDASENSPYSARVTVKVPGIPGEVTLSPTEVMLMSHAVEDWYGLWEFEGTSNYEPRELEGASNRHALLVAAMRHLVELGLIEMGSIAWDAWATGIAPTVASMTDAIGLVENPGNWATGRDIQIVFSATSLGERLFLRQPESQ